LPIKLGSSGEYNILEKKLTAKVLVKDFSPEEFSGYYRAWGINLSEGNIDGLLDILLKESNLDISLNVQSKGLLFSQGKIKARLNLEASSNLQYNLKDKQVGYSGIVKVTHSEITGVDFVEKISAVNGSVKFDHSGLSSENLSADIFGIPIKAKAGLSDFSNPLLNIDFSSKVGLNVLSGILKDKFSLVLPGTVKGEANLSVKIESKLPLTGLPQVKGELELVNAALKLERVNSVFEDLSGKLQFSPSQVEWSALSFKYGNVFYKTNGKVTNFSAPLVALGVVSEKFSLSSDFAINGKTIKFSKFNGKYVNSGFSVLGEIDLADPENIGTNINAALNIDLNDAKELFKNLKVPIEQINPKGVVLTECSLKGKIKDLKSCEISAQLSSGGLSLYGLKSGDFLLNYKQANGIVDISNMRLSLYDGTVDLTGKMNLASVNLPYWINIDLQGIKIEKLKMDTPIKDKDISGVLQAQAKINGFSNDLSKISGAGKIFITDGKLWELNLFKGLGQLLFTKDFASINFSEGYCGFNVQDKFIFTDNLRLKSALTDITGSAKIGFDSSIDASLNVEVLSDAPATGTIKDLTTAILGQAGRFGVIKITGSLGEPKFRFKPAVMDIFKGLKDSLFSN